MIKTEAMSPIPDPISIHLSSQSLSQGEPAIRQEIALQLYQRQVFSFGQALAMAKVSVWELQFLLGHQNIPRRYSPVDLADDMQTIAAGF
jgi:predicted HTH domain antitoxin